METQVGLAQETSDGFLASLRESDTQFRNMNPKEFRGALEKYIGQQWGSPACKAFTSTQGAPSWVVDLSDVLGGLVYYAVVTTGSDGRHVAGFVDEDQVAQVVQTGQEPTIENPEQTPQMDPSEPSDGQVAQRLREELQAKEQTEAGLRNEIEALRSQVALLEAKPDDPVLVRHKVVEAQKKIGEEEKADWVPVITTHNEVGKVIADLLEKGTKAHNIEIWSRKSSPRVKIEW